MAVLSMLVSSAGIGFRHSARPDIAFDDICGLEKFFVTAWSTLSHLQIGGKDASICVD